ncbi:hypothetical protein ACFL6U_30405 [Planctomycetota bacterium]
MSPEITEAALVDMLVHQEELVSQLYRTYADRFPEHKVFWADLADEEMNHAAWLRRLYARAQTGTGVVKIERVDLQTIQDNIRTAERFLAASDQCTLGMSEALRAALQLEECICESEYFSIFEGDSEWAEFKQVQYCLAEATQHHVDKIRTLLEQSPGAQL